MITDFWKGVLETGSHEFLVRRDAWRKRSAVMRRALLTREKLREPLRAELAFAARQEKCAQPVLEARKPLADVRDALHVGAETLERVEQLLRVPTGGPLLYEEQHLLFTVATHPVVHLLFRQCPPVQTLAQDVLAERSRRARFCFASAPDGSSLTLHCKIRVEH